VSSALEKLMRYGNGDLKRSQKKGRGRGLERW